MKFVGRVEAAYLGRAEQGTGADALQPPLRCGFQQQLTPGVRHLKGEEMDKLFWIIPEKLAGRPGPDQEPWNLAAMRQGGIGAVLSVNNGLLCHPEDFVAAGITYACVPLSDNAPPQPGDDHICRRALPQAYAFVQAQMAQGHGVVVHCSAGKDRTGLFLCYFLMQHAHLSPTEAIQAVRHVRPIALSAVGWEEFARQVLRGLV